MFFHEKHEDAEDHRGKSEGEEITAAIHDTLNTDGDVQDVDIAPSSLSLDQVVVVVTQFPVKGATEFTNR